ncbi:MAG: tRNA lysidine(34) synthetase TilS, partial [Oscillospiraceae bacterium]|nr:tRNA lysidine(34) synthetase TilS [Oscillospiraceae bacterium]
MNPEIVLSRDLLPPGSRVLCAVSGGADSVCLLHLVRSLGDVECLCAHFDHGLRGEASREDAAFVEALCRKWEIPFHTETGDVAAFARQTGRSLETAGRELRYAFLRRTAARCGADRIATAHNRDDNAETILFRMARGTGLRGLCGIPAERDGIVRPLLETSREEIRAYLVRRNIPWREDATNAEDAAARNRVRHHVLPALEDVHPGAAANIARMGSVLREDEETLAALAAEKLAAWGGERLPAAELAALP